MIPSEPVATPKTAWSAARHGTRPSLKAPAAAHSAEGQRALQASDSATQLAEKQRSHAAVLTLGGRHDWLQRTRAQSLLATISGARSGDMRCMHAQLHAVGSPPCIKQVPSQSAVARQLIVPCGSLPPQVAPMVQLAMAGQPSRVAHAA